MLHLLFLEIAPLTQYSRPSSFAHSLVQARVGVLLLALLFFNNVFFGLQIFSPFPRFFFR